MEYSDFKKKNNKEILYLKNHESSTEKKLPLLHYNLLDKTRIVDHCFTTREGGVSTGFFSELNLSFTRGDEKEAVLENYRRLAQSLQTTPDNFVCSDQTHTVNVMRVDERHRGMGVICPKTYSDIDGLITNVPGIVLSTFYADCVPLFFVDPVNKAIGLSHSGWRGTVNRMGFHTIEAMKREFGTKAEDIVAAVGPSICMDCYEISEDVADEFKKAFAGHEEEILLDKGNGKYQLDLWKSNEIVLKEAGVKEENIAISNICTCCNPKLLFSHRASQGKRGNLGAFLVLRNS